MLQLSFQAMLSIVFSVSFFLAQIKTFSSQFFFINSILFTGNTSYLRVQSLFSYHIAFSDQPLHQETARHVGRIGLFSPTRQILGEETKQTSHPGIVPQM